MLGKCAYWKHTVSDWNEMCMTFRINTCFLLNQSRHSRWAVVWPGPRVSTWIVEYFAGHAEGSHNFHYDTLHGGSWGIGWQDCYHLEWTVTVLWAIHSLEEALWNRLRFETAYKRKVPTSRYDGFDQTTCSRCDSEGRILFISLSNSFVYFCFI